MSVIGFATENTLSDRGKLAQPSGASPETSFRFEIVNTPMQMEKGLGGRMEIPHDYGMLFVFPKDGLYSFWMKDMMSSIDMLWLSDKGEVVYLKESVSPDTYPSVFHSDVPARYVLETRAGEATRKGWSVGSVIALPLPYGK